MTTIGERVKELRLQRGWTLGQLAQRSGVAESYLSRLERDHYKSPGMRNLTKIAEAFGIPPRSILSVRTPSVDERIAVLLHRYPDLKAAFLNASFKLDDAGVELLINAIEGSLKFYEQQQRRSSDPAK